MRDSSKYVVSIVGAGALVVSVLTNALASSPSPQLSRPDRTQTVKGNLTVTGVIHANKNETVYGNFYTKGKAEIYKGLLIRGNGLTVNSGGVKTDTLDVGGALHAQSGVIDQNLNVTGNVQAANLSGSSLTVSGATTLSGKLTASGGIDAGGAGLTTTGTISTTGNLAAGNATVGSLTDTGTLIANGLTATGTVNFSNATVTGLNLSNIVGTGNLNLQHLALGTPTQTTAPLTLAENSQTTTISVDQAGNVQVPTLSTVGNATIGGNVLITGASNGLQTNLITSPQTTSGSTTTLTPLAIKGSTITLTGDTTVAGTFTESGAATHNGATTFNNTATVAGNNDLVLASAAASGSTPATASHILGNTDVDGRVSVTVPATVTTDQISNVIPFIRPYTATPTVVITAVGDPAPWASPAVQPKAWVELHQDAQGRYDGFRIHYTPPAPGAPTGGATVTYNYIVVG